VEPVWPEIVVFVAWVFVAAFGVLELVALIAGAGTK
jgi:hypothetical protein